MSDIKVNNLSPEDQMSDLTDSELGVTGGGYNNRGGDGGNGGNGGDAKNYNHQEGEYANVNAQIATGGDGGDGGNGGGVGV